MLSTEEYRCRGALHECYYLDPGFRDPSRVLALFERICIYVLVIMITL